MSPLFSTLCIVFGGALLVAACVVVKHRLAPPDPEEEPREFLAEYISMMVGMIYALVLGLALVAVWDTHSSAESNVQTEAGALHQVYLLSDALPPAAQQQTRDAATAYAHHVVGVEWGELARRQPLDASGWQLLDRIRATYTKSDASSAVPGSVAQEALAQLSTLDEARRGRESDAQHGMAGILWAGLFIGGALTVGFMFLFGVQRRAGHLVMVMGLAGLITFLILLIQQLDQPFGHYLGIDPEPFIRYFPG